MKLYDFELSGNCYKIRLFLALIGKDYERAPVDLRSGAHKRPPLIGLNPFCEVPILADDDVCLRDSQAILVYLARRYGGEIWLPTEAAAMARVIGWLMVAENEIARGPNDARLAVKFGVPLDRDAAQARAERVLGLLEARLADRPWLETDQPTIADIACFPYVALAPEGGIQTEGYPNISAWGQRIRALPGFIPMPGL